jgi:hypothetical protein
MWLTRLTDPALRELIGEAARQHVEQHFGHDAFLQAIAE